MTIFLIGGKVRFSILKKKKMKYAYYKKKEKTTRNDKKNPLFYYRSLAVIWFQIKFWVITRTCVTENNCKMFIKLSVWMGTFPNFYNYTLDYVMYMLYYFNLIYLSSSSGNLSWFAQRSFSLFLISGMVIFFCQWWVQYNSTWKQKYI